MNHSRSPISLLLLFSLLSSQTSAFVRTNGLISEQESVRSSLSLLRAASSNVIDLQDSNFRDYFASQTPILIDAYAQWCGPCKLIEPVVDQCALDRKDSLVVSRYDVESDNNEIKLEFLLQRAMPEALPSLILIQKNKVLGTKSGLITTQELDEFLNESLSRSSSLKAAGLKKENEDKTRRIQRKGFISFMYQLDDYMLKDDQL